MINEVIGGVDRLKFECHVNVMLPPRRPTTQVDRTYLRGTEPWPHGSRMCDGKKKRKKGKIPRDRGLRNYEYDSGSGASTRAPTFDSAMFTPFPPRRPRAGANERNARLRMNAEMMKRRRSPRRRRWNFISPPAEEGHPFYLS